MILTYLAFRKTCLQLILFLHSSDKKTVSNPKKVFEGDNGALMAVRKYEKIPVSENNFWL